MRSPSEEDYLKGMWTLQMAGEQVTTGALATRLAVSPASATAMVRKLVAAGLCRREPYQPATLTEDGVRQAALVVRKHRLVELFLSRVLGLAWDEVHPEAEQLEHALSDRVLERMAEQLDHPDVDVHGHPIPGPDGTLVPHDDLPLGEAPTGERLEVSQVDDGDGELLRHLDALGLRPGTALQIEGRDPFEGPLRCRVAGQTQALGHQLVAALRVHRAPKSTREQQKKRQHR